MAQDRGAAGSPDDEPEATGREVSDSPESWGNNGFLGEGRYRLTHRLGRGGMAEVFAAEDVRLGRTVAVKLLRADLAEDPVSKARFTREAQSVAGLNHHAVVAVYDSGEEQVGSGAVPYIVMELIHGRTIRELLMDAEAPPPEQALVIVSGVLEALAYSHRHGIVHRDIKPANVIITDGGAVKVMDFGIARALHGAAQTMTQTGMVMGTPQYLSPEQALGKTVDTRSDLYAVGCLLYELLAHRPPFVGESPLAVVYQHVQDTARPPSEVAPSAPPELDGLVMRALTKDPDDRYQTAEEMRGMVQYALRMLEEHGGHTGGLWNTGSVTGGATPPMGTPAAGAAATGLRPGAAGAGAATGQLTAPMLLGNPGRPDGGEPGGGVRRPRRGRLVLVALAALVAVGAGVLMAANLGGEEGGGGGAGPSGSPTETQERDDLNQNRDEAEETQRETEDSTGDADEEDYYPPDSGDSGGDWESQDPSDTETTEGPTSEAPTTPDDETDGGGSEGTDEGAAEGDTGTDAGTSEGDTGTDTGTSEGDTGTDTGTSEGDAGSTDPGTTTEGDAGSTDPGTTTEGEAAVSAGSGDLGSTTS
jgi:serine/threonine-protein kinase